MQPNRQEQAARIAVVVLYFGQLPWYFRFFAASCARNTGVDFLFLTDCTIGQPLPSNIIVIRRQLKDIRDLAVEKLGFPVSLDNAYKLCDFRPAFGLIFSDLFEEYDFWGYSDLDVIFGDIRSMITEETLQAYDVISVRAEYITGFFSLFRNNETTRYLFRESRDHKKVFQEPSHYCFDECNFNHDLLKAGQSVFQVRSEIQCATYVVKKLQLSGRLRAHFKTLIEEEPVGRLAFREGTLTFDSRQKILLYHLIFFKDRPYLFIPAWKEIPPRFYIQSFYISRHHPRSVMGILTGTVLHCWRAMYLPARQLQGYADWLRKFLGTSNRIRPGYRAKGITGTYKDENVLVDIVEKSGRLYAQWKRDSFSNRVHLFHKKDNRFLVRKLGSFINIDIEFHFDAGQSAYALHILPFRRPGSILYKIA